MSSTNLLDVLCSTSYKLQSTQVCVPESRQKLVLQVADADLQTLLLWKNTRMPLREQTLAVSLA